MQNMPLEQAKPAPPPQPSSGAHRPLAAMQPVLPQGRSSLQAPSVHTCEVLPEQRCAPPWHSPHSPFLIMQPKLPQLVKSLQRPSLQLREASCAAEH